MKLPAISGKRLVEVLLRAGFFVHRTHGSHYILKHSESGRRVTIPYHRTALAPKTLHSILMQAGISTEDLTNLM